MKKLTLLVALIVVLVAGTWWFKRSPATSSPTPTSVSANDHKNTAYEIEGEPILLKNGTFETEAAPGSAEKVTTEYFGNEVSGDFNNDGTQDTAFLLTQSGGGTGVFYYVVVALNTADGYVGTNGIALGDRIAPQSGEWRNGELIINYADRTASESYADDPTLGVSKYFKVQGRQLIEVKK